jgi:putative toxin-antitoxin system antitoxin component (TIGR02293 family)
MEDGGNIKSAVGNIDDLAASWLSMNLPTAQIESVMALAASIFEDRRMAREWLNRPNLATDNKPPIALLGSEEGFLRVTTLLRRIEYGILA